MAKINESIIPLAEQPEYKAAISKVVEIGRALGAVTEKLEQCRASLFEAQNNSQSSPGLIDRALELASGAPRPESRPVVTMAAEVARIEAERKELHDGLIAANDAADTVARALAAKVGADAKGRHVAAVARILECLEALCAANKGERAVREELEKLGYDSHRLPYQELGAIGRIEDSLGCPAYYYAKEAKAYIASQKAK